MSDPRYLAEIQGANGSKAFALGRAEDGSTVQVFAQTHDSLEWHALLLGTEFDEEGHDGYCHPVALFATREAARDAALAAHWNNQSLRVRAARGKIREQGRDVKTPPLGWTSCQEGVTS